MEDFLESFSFVSSRFCFVISLSCVREAVKRGKIPTWIGRLLESPGSHYTRRKLNIPTMLMRRTDKAYPLKLRSSFRIKVEDDERGTLLLPWIHRDTQKILRKRKDAEYSRFREVEAPARLFICWFSQLKGRPLYLPLVVVVVGRERLLLTLTSNSWIHLSS
jgi:hypothetical protein